MQLRIYTIGQTSPPFHTRTMALCNDCAQYLSTKPGLYATREYAIVSIEGTCEHCERDG